MHRLYQCGHILLPPCGKVHRTAGRKLHRVDAFLGGGVKIIVKVDAIHRIVLQKFRHALHHIIRSGRLCRVQVQPVAHRTHPLRMGVGKVILRKAGRHGGRGPQPVGVQPRFHREPPPVGFLQEDVQRVKAGVCPLHPGAQVAPWKQAAAIQRVPEGPHLRQHRVQPKARTIVQHLCAPGAEGVRRGKIQQRPFQIADPHSPPLACRQGRVINVLLLFFCFILSGKLFAAQPQPRAHAGGGTGTQQKAAPAKAARLHFRFFRPAPLGHRVSS